jgi:hypothetical protein
LREIVDHFPGARGNVLDAKCHTKIAAFGQHLAQSRGRAHGGRGRIVELMRKAGCEFT